MTTDTLVIRNILKCTKMQAIKKIKIGVWSLMLEVGSYWILKEVIVRILFQVNKRTHTDLSSDKGSPEKCK
jgi:hypothetical protein